MYARHRKPHQLAQYSLNHVLALASVSGLLYGCSPPELSATQEDLVRSCLQQAEPNNENAACKDVTEEMRDAFFQKHGEFHEQMLTTRKAAVAKQITKDQQGHDQLARCVDDLEAGKSGPASCEVFKPHEIRRETENRRRTRCGQAHLDGNVDASQRCKGLSEQEVADEIQAEHVKREARLGR